jgi:hypothetical protein
MTEPENYRLRPYQIEVATAVLDSVDRQKGLTFSVEIARQGGKNEISSWVELILMAAYVQESRNLVKCSPTFKPQTVISMMRLKEKLNLAGLGEYWTSEMGYIIRLGECRAIFLSADKSSNVVGNTAHLLLEVDEAQDVEEEKFVKEFRPMGSTTNVTSVLYGTTWDDSTLLEKIKQINLELEHKDGIRRHFQYDWQEISKYNGVYRTYAENQMKLLGEDHPLFLTQYRLLPIRGGGGFLTMAQRAQLQGTQIRRRTPEAGKAYIAGIDLAGEAETGPDDYLKFLKPKIDSTVMTIGEVENVPSSQIKEPGNGLYKMNKIKIVEHYSWTGKKHAELYSQLINLIKNVWRCRKIVVDATGIGQPIASFLKETLGSKITPFVFTAASKTELGFNLLAAINSGSIKMYSADNSPEYLEFWNQMEKARGYYHPGRTMEFYVDPRQGHDDYLISLALLAEAGKQYDPREARGNK